MERLRKKSIQQCEFLLWRNNEHLPSSLYNGIYVCIIHCFLLEQRRISSHYNQGAHHIVCNTFQLSISIQLVSWSTSYAPDTNYLQDEYPLRVLNNVCINCKCQTLRMKLISLLKLTGWTFMYFVILRSSLRGVGGLILMIHSQLNSLAMRNHHFLIYFLMISQEFQLNTLIFPGGGGGGGGGGGLLEKSRH